MQLPQRIGPSSAPPASRQGPALAGAPRCPEVLTNSVALTAAAHTHYRLAGPFTVTSTLPFYVTPFEEKAPKKKKKHLKALSL